MEIVQRYADVSFVLLVTGAAMLWAPLALIVAGGYFAVLGAINWFAARGAAPEAEA
jgi:hypothetical protein